MLRCKGKREKNAVVCQLFMSVDAVAAVVDITTTVLLTTVFCLVRLARKRPFH